MEALLKRGVGLHALTLRVRLRPDRQLIENADQRQFGMSSERHSIEIGDEAATDKGNAQGFLDGRTGSVRLRHAAGIGQPIDLIENPPPDMRNPPRAKA